MNAKALAMAAAVLLFVAAPDIASAGGGGRGGGHGGGHAGGRWSGGHGHSGFRGHSHGGHFHGGHFRGGHFRGGHFGAHRHGGGFVAVNPWWWSAPSWYAPGYGAAVYGGYRAHTYWYYCQSAGAYYPYVLTCPEPWVPVVP